MNHPLVRYAVPAVGLEAALLGIVLLDAPFRSFGVLLGLITVAFGAYLIAARFGWKDAGAGRGTLIFLFAAGVVFRVTLLPFPHSDDLHRYVWEGRMQHEGGWNPFAHRPDSPELEPLRDAIIFPRLNGKAHETIYPPLAQLVFLATAAVSCSFTAFKVVFVGFDLGCGLFLLLLLRRRGAPPARVLLYLWCPAVLFSIAARGHVDAVEACFVVMALWLSASGRVRSSALALGLAVMAKTVSIVLLPAFFLHAERRRDLWPVLVPFLLYLPYANAGYGLIKSLVMFGTEWSTNASLYEVLSFGGAAPVLVYAVAAVAYGIVLLRARSVEHAAFAARGCWLVFSPTVHPWYIAGLIPFLALRWRPAWLLLSYTLFFYYAFFISGNWRPIDWMPILEYTPFYLVLVWPWVGRFPRGTARWKTGSRIGAS